MNYDNDFYATMMNLSPEEGKDLAELTGDNEFLDQVVGEYAAIWSRCQKNGGSLVRIRRRILVRMKFAALEHSSAGHKSAGVEAAFTLWLCERVERHAEDMAKAEIAARPSCIKEGK